MVVSTVLNDNDSLENLSLALSPYGQLSLYSEHSDESITPSLAKQIIACFSLGAGVGLLRLGVINIPATSGLPPSIDFWRQFAQLFITQVCKETNSDSLASVQIPCPQNELQTWLSQAPFMRGSEYLNHDLARQLWQELFLALTQELQAYNGDLNAYLAAFHAVWNTVGRVCFHLAENKTNPHKPFAFLATYTTGITQNSRAKHLALAHALQEYSGNQQKSFLLNLLLPVQRAAEQSSLVRAMVDDASIFRTLAWEAKDAYQFLREIPLFEEAGIIVRVPNWWNYKKPPRPSISIAIGDKSAKLIGFKTLLDFDMHFALPSGEQITLEEFEALLKNSEQLVQFRGQWIQVDSAKLKQVLAHWKNVERQVKHDGLSFSAGLRLLSGMPTLAASGELADADVTAWSNIVPGAWLNQSLQVLRDPALGGNQRSHSILQQYLQASLRPYQQLGVQWLWSLYNMSLGGCLADDMGLGKTIQVISMLLLIKYQSVPAAKSGSMSLLVLPASLIGNWQAEIQRFAPALQIWVAHSAYGSLESPPTNDYDLVITTYSMLARLEWLVTTSWEVVILDEAQAIKNPGAKQTTIAKKLISNVRFALTGTPIENSLLDLWSLFDFVAPGLLGANRQFANYAKEKAPQLFKALRQLVAPYILRRLKSDKSIINDLPDKTEMQTYCSLSKQQIGLYQQAVDELAAKLKSPLSDIKRSGLVLSYLLRFKQICNHPTQWLGHGEYDLAQSGKFKRMQEICEVIVQKQEKLLVFTQFKEIIPALCTFLAEIFGRDGLYLHGQTAIKERSKLAASFQAEDGPPFFVLSLKAGGTGLNLTAAAHVIHFDRWWNPAVENQATDRAYRIGQKKNVLVHKFICQGTIEEKIDEMINNKKHLSSEVIGEKNEVVLTELSDADLIRVVSLDLDRVLGAD